MTENKTLDSLKAIHEYAWNWFSYHAAQRMTVFRFFFLVFGVVSVGYYQTLDDRPILAVAFSVIGIFLTFLFWRLDLRTQELIKIGEDLLLATETEFSKLKLVPVKLVKEADTKRSAHATKWFPRKLYSYGDVFPAIFSLVLISATLSLIYSLHLVGLF
jgi:hypothetical protein